MNPKEMAMRQAVERELEKKGKLDAKYAKDFRHCPELRDIADNDFPNTVFVVPDRNRTHANNVGISVDEAYQVAADNLVMQLDALNTTSIQAAIAWGFSVGNWQRPHDQVEGLMHLMNKTVNKLRPKILERNGRFIHLGRKEVRGDKAEEFPEYPELLANMKALEEETRLNRGKIVAAAIDFNGRDQDIRSHQKAVEYGTQMGRLLQPGEHIVLGEDQLWCFRDGFGALHSADLGIRTGEKAHLKKGVGMFHTSDAGWPGLGETYWVTFEKPFPLLSLKDTATAIRAYAIEEKKQGK